MVKVKDFEVQDTCEYLLYLGYIRLQMCFDANETLHGHLPAGEPPGFALVRDVNIGLTLSFINIGCTQRYSNEVKQWMALIYYTCFGKKNPPFPHG